MSFFDENRPHNGRSYDAYVRYWREKAATPLEEAADRSARKRLHYYRYNLDRSESVHEAYEPSESLREAVASIPAPHLWMVITEPWCGDSAYNLPVIAEAAALTDAITLRILLRDDNLDIMDQYLTSGSRSIPKLVAFSEDGSELFTWGPRPEGARALRQQLVDEGASKETVIDRLLAHYEDGGWRAVEDELVEALTHADSLV